jgi:hypothetical protein
MIETVCYKMCTFSIFFLKDIYYMHTL